MNAKTFLRQYENITRRRRKLIQELENAEAEADTIRSTSDNDGMPHGSNIGHPTEEKAIRIADIKRTLFAMKSDILCTRLEIVNAIMKVDGYEQDVLYLRYIKLLKWEDIAVSINRSWQQTHRYHRSGLEKIEKIIADEIE